MRKRVLLAEQSDTIRGVAETALRQNGYEVISVASAEKALEVLKFTCPDLMIVGSELTTSDQRPLFEKIPSRSRGGPTAMLLLNDSGGGLPFPPEAVIGRPFDAGEFLEKVTRLTEQPAAPQEQASPNPLEQSNLDDDFLDAALGIDRIDVTDSEVMNKTTLDRKSASPKSPEKFIGFDHDDREQDRSAESGKVESLMIRDGDVSDIRRSPEEQQRPTDEAGSGALEIVPDQYVLSDPDALKDDAGSRVHDYEWFIDEMRKETDDSLRPPQATTSKSGNKEATPELTVSDPASMIDPTTPPPSSAPPAGAIGPKTGASVDKFLDDFKKEVDRLRSQEPPSVKLAPEASPPGAVKGEHDWRESIQNVTPEQIGLFTHRLTRELAERIADKIVARIDSDKLLNLLKNEILSHARNQDK